MRKDKSGAIFVILVNPDITSHILDGQFADSQSQPCTLHELVQLFETLEYQLLFIFGDSGAGISYREQHTLLLFVHFIIQRNTSSGRSEFQGIVQQIDNNLLQAQGICVEPCKAL